MQTNSIKRLSICCGQWPILFPAIKTLYPPYRPAVKQMPIIWSNWDSTMRQWLRSIRLWFTTGIIIVFIMPKGWFMRNRDCMILPMFIKASTNLISQRREISNVIWSLWNAGKWRMNSLWASYSVAIWMVARSLLSWMWVMPIPIRKISSFLILPIRPVRILSMNLALMFREVKRYGWSLDGVGDSLRDCPLLCMWDGPMSFFQHFRWMCLSDTI